MTTHAFLLGGAGQVGQGAARRLTREGWRVTVASLSGRPEAALTALGVTQVQVDRTEPAALADAVPDDTDLLVDCVCFTPADARQLVALGERVGAMVVLSTLSVYVDAAGRSLDEADSDAAFPHYPVPVTEDQPTLAPGEATYSTKKAAVEQILLDEAVVPVTVLRPGAIHGPGTRHAREWYFVKRALDKRPFVALAYRGESRFQPTSTANLAEAVWRAAQRPGRRALNLADPDAPTVIEIGRAVAALLDHEWAELLLPGAPVGTVGGTPWSIPRPFVASSGRAAAEIGYEPVHTYAEALTSQVPWLVAATAGRDWREVLPDLVDNYASDFFDYAAEDSFLRTSSDW